MTEPTPGRRVKTRWIAALSALAFVGLAPAVPSAMALAPEPAPVPRRWQLEVETSALRMTVVNLPDGPRAVLFMTYKVTNNSTSDLLFAPSFELATDDMAVLRSGRDVSVAVTNTLLDRLESPMIQDQISIVGNLLRGEENAKEGLVVWPVPSLFQNELTVYCSGFSGETATMDIPNPATGKVERKVLRKTLELRYRLPGELVPAAGGEYVPYSSRWIMR